MEQSKNNAPNLPPQGMPQGRPDPAVMKKVGLLMSVFMSIVMSICLTLTGLISAGKFTIPAFCINVLISFVISLCIGLIVPMNKINASARKALGLKPHGLAGRAVESLISDLIYTPVLTLVMVALAHRQATAHGAMIPFLPMFLKSLGLCLLVAYVIIFLITPVLLGCAMRLAENRNSSGPLGQESE